MRLAYAFLILAGILGASAVHAAVLPDVVYWDSPQGKMLHKHIRDDADYWQLSPNFTAQITQSYCGVASATTVLNSLPIKKPVDPRYEPYAYFTQNNFFSPAVSKIIKAQTVMAMGMTREEMVKTLNASGAQASSIAGDFYNETSLRNTLKRALGDDGQFVLANYLRAELGQVGGGHWSVLAAYDAKSDHVLILDVAKYKYRPSWVSIAALLRSIDTTDDTSGLPRGLVFVNAPK